MAIIYSYPTGTPNGTDYLIGTQTDPITEENRTLQFSITQVATLATQGYLESTTTITKAQWQALQATDVVLVAAPGGAQYIKVLDLSALFVPETVTPVTMAFGDISIGTTASASTTKAQALLPVGISGITTTTVYSAQVIASIIDAGQALIIGTQAGTTGNGSLQVKVRYQILDTTAF